MEVGAHVWLRREESHWGWVPAIITKKETVVIRGVELVNLTLNDDPNIEETMPSPAVKKFGRSDSDHYGDHCQFEVVITVDPEQLKTADHDDIKLRNLPTSYHLSGEDPEAQVVASPSTHSSPRIVGGVDDLIALTHLHEPAILHALRLRYDANIIYTNTGPILIAVNPFKKMDIYSDAIMAKYCLQGETGSSNPNANAYKTPFRHRPGGTIHTPGRVQATNKLPPHVYQTADDAYRAMLRGLENKELMKTPASIRRGDSGLETSQRGVPTNQSVLVSGESGAGKTVTTKIVLNYLAMLSKRRGSDAIPHTDSSRRSFDTHSIEQQVLQSNPILESFGNARTIRNDNSSRFGKYIDIRFSRAGKLSGASIETYLLEKVRLIHPGQNERNYHIFYQLLAGATGEERRELLLGNMQVKDFKILCQTGTYGRRDGIDDRENHTEMLDAMITMGFSPSLIKSLMRMVVGILYGGNVTFTPSRDGESCRMADNDAAYAFAELLGLRYEELAAALTTRVLLAGDEIVHRSLTVEAANKALESLMKTLYGAMFDLLVDLVNSSITNEGDGMSTASIGVLDIFGFESFDMNNFEQLCINYTNEALQQQFNRFVFKLEQQEYEKEGIMWKFISFPDNQDVLDLIDQKHSGILALLDEQCILPSSSDEKFTRYLYARCDKHPRFHASSSQRVRYVFSIQHYAGYVEYTTDTWLEKNKDELPAASSDLLKSSSFSLISEVQRYIRAEERGGRGTVATKSVSSQFSSQLRVLRSRIEHTVPHYVRCLKPNDDLAPDFFEPKNIVEQLRCGGVLEAVRVSRAGYPTRYPHDVFLARYYILNDSRDKSPQSPIFSPGNQTPKIDVLKRLVSKIAYDLWYADHQMLTALLNAEAEQDEEKRLDSQQVKNQMVHRSSLSALQKKVKLHNGPRGPSVNLVVESSVISPENVRRRSQKDLPTVAMRERRERSGVIRPENESEFRALDFASRCAIAGLQLGRTKVFLRREAFDRIEALRSERFFTAAATIQKIVRGKICREYFLTLRAAAIKIQCMIRMRLSFFKLEGLKILNAIIVIQSSWRRYISNVIVADLRKVQRAQLRSKQPSEDDIIRAVITMQSRHRGRMARHLLAYLKQEAIKKARRDSLREMEEQKRKREEQERAEKERLQQQMKATKTANMSSQSSGPLLSELFSEIQNENWAMVESILDKHPELAEATDLKSGELALHKIVRHSGAWTLLIDMVLVLYPKALIHRDNMGALPIHHASAHDNLAALEIIYSAYKEGINEHDKVGRLPIHVAANYDAVDATKFLLSKSPDGAYTMVYRPPPDNGGGLPLHVACSNHASIGVITALLAENFASAKRADENGDLPLHLLLRCGEVVDPVVVKTLLTCFTGALSRTDMNGDLPLAIAIKHQCRSAVVNALLMQYPNAASVLNGEGHSPIFLAFKHNADDRTIMGLLNHAPELATSVDKKTGLLPIQIATENEHSHFIVHNLLKRDLPIDINEKVRAQLVPHRYSWNHVVSNTEDLYHQVVTKILQSCTQPQVLALAHVEGPDGKIALASATPVCKHEMRVMLRLFNTLEVVNQRPAYTNPTSDTQIFYALRYEPPPSSHGAYTIIHDEKKDGGDNDFVEDFDDHSVVSAVSRVSMRSTLTSRSQQTIEDKLRHIRREKGQQVIAKLTSRSDVVERELKVRKDHHLSRHYVPAIISVHHTVQHAAYAEAMAEPGYCITMEGADTTAENLMLDMRKSGKSFPIKPLKRIGISLLHMHEHGVIHGDFGTHNIGKFGSRWKLLGVGGSVPIGEPTDPNRGFYHPPEAIVVENRRVSIGKKNCVADVISVSAHPTYDIWAYGIVVYEAIAGVPLSPYACRGKRQMTMTEVYKIGAWDENSLKKALRHVNDDNVARDLLKRLLHHDPQRRFNSMRDVLEHPFFTGGSLQSDASRKSASPVTAPAGNPASFSEVDNERISKVKSNENGIQSVRLSQSSDNSIENRENNSMRRRPRMTPSDASSVGSEKSSRSSRGFRFLRRQQPHVKG